MIAALVGAGLAALALGSAVTGEGRNRRRWRRRSADERATGGQVGEGNGDAGAEEEYRRRLVVARREASAIIGDARTQAAEIVAEAEKQGEALVSSARESAGRAATEIRADAKRTARIIVRDAERAAERIVSGAEHERSRLEKEAVEERKLAHDVRRELSGLLSGLLVDVERAVGGSTAAVQDSREAQESRNR